MLTNILEAKKAFWNLGLEMDNHLKEGGIPFGRDAEPRRCMEVAVGTEEGIIWKYW